MKNHAMLPAILVFAACSTDPGGDLTSRDGGLGAGLDGASNGGRDAGFRGSDSDGAVLDGGDVDGGGPLEEPRSAFCDGMGTVVVVGAGGECAGEIAEEVFRFALCACDAVRIGANLSLDAFDSSIGPYGGDNVLDDGSLGLNGALDVDGKLEARGSAFVHGGGFSVGPDSDISGTVYANGDAVQERARTRIGRNAFFDGDVLGRFVIDGTLQVPVTASIADSVTSQSVVRGPVTTVPPCPCDDDQILDIGALTAWAETHNDNDFEPRVLTSTTWADGDGPSTVTLPCGRYYVSRILAPNGLSIRVEGRVVLFVDGDMTIDGPLDIDIQDGAELDLFVRGNLSVAASARFGSAATPAKTRTYVGGEDTIALAASTVFGGNLYAPRASVRFSASAELYGALFAQDVDFGASADIHFDSAIRTAGDDCEEPDGGVVDGGPPVDAGARDGGVVDGGPECETDLDCPAPELCVQGRCDNGI